jgi:hypothetical protein
VTVSFNDTLERFNRKERNLLIRTALGHSQDAPLLLPETFCNQLTGTLGSRKTNPADVRWWTDYHLNWLVAAVKIFGDETAVGRRHIKSGMESNSEPDIKSNLEDLDLLVGIERPERHLIGIEAKNRQFNSEDRDQIESKLKRLDPLYQMFAKVGIGFHFMFMTPDDCDPTRKLNLSRWPWVSKDSRIPWLPLLQCDAKQPLILECSCFAPGKRDGKKDHWRCRPDIRPGQSIDDGVVELLTKGK